MAYTGYVANTGATVLVSTDQRTILGVRSGGNFGLRLKGARVSPVSGVGSPVLVQLCACTWATQPPGTASTEITPEQSYGLEIQPGFTAARHWTTEPTVLSVLEEISISGAGRADWLFPLGQEPDCVEGHGFALRCTASSNVQVRASILIERT